MWETLESYWIRAVMISFFAALMYLNFRFETRAIDTYLQNQIAATSSPDDESYGYKIAPDKSGLNKMEA